MLVHIPYNGFTMRDDTEFVHHTDGAEAFFKDHGIEFTLDTIGDQKVIRYHENNDKLQLPVETLDDIEYYTAKYNFELTFGSNLPEIRFVK